MEWALVNLCGFGSAPVAHLPLSVVTWGKEPRNRLARLESTFVIFSVAVVAAVAHGTTSWFAYTAVPRFLECLFKPRRQARIIKCSKPKLAQDRRVHIRHTVEEESDWVSNPDEYTFERAISKMAIPQYCDVSAEVIETACKLERDEQEALELDADQSVLSDSSYQRMPEFGIGPLRFGSFPPVVQGLQPPPEHHRGWGFPASDAPQPAPSLPIMEEETGWRQHCPASIFPSDINGIPPSELEELFELVEDKIDKFSADLILIDPKTKDPALKCEIKVLHGYKSKTLRYKTRIKDKLEALEKSKPTEEALLKELESKSQQEEDQRIKAEIIKWGADFHADEFVRSLRTVDPLPTDFTPQEKYQNAVWEDIFHEPADNTWCAYFTPGPCLPSYIDLAIEVFSPSTEVQRALIRKHGRGITASVSRFVSNARNFLFPLWVVLPGLGRRAITAIHDEKDELLRMTMFEELLAPVSFEETRLVHYDRQINENEPIRELLKVVRDQVFSPNGSLGSQRQVHVSGQNIDLIITREVQKVFARLGLSSHPLGCQVFTWLGPACIRHCRQFTLPSAAQLNHCNERARTHAGIQFGAGQ